MLLVLQTLCVPFFTWSKTNGGADVKAHRSHSFNRDIVYDMAYQFPNASKCRQGRNIEGNCSTEHRTYTWPYPPRSPNSLAQSSNSWRPCLLTEGLMLIRLASKSTNPIGLISSIDMESKASPRLRSGPIAASFARAVMSEPEKPGYDVRKRC